MASSEISAPCLVVQWFTEAPTTITVSAWGSSSAANGEAKPPEIPNAYGRPANRPLAGADVARIAPVCPPRASRSSRASARTAPRPAMIAVRFALTSASAAFAIARGFGAGGSNTGSGGCDRVDRMPPAGAGCRSAASAPPAGARSRPAGRRAARRRRRSSGCARGRRSPRPTRPGRAGRSGSSTSAPRPAHRRRARAPACGSWPPRSGR